MIEEWSKERGWVHDIRAPISPNIVTKKNCQQDDYEATLFRMVSLLIFSFGARWWWKVRATHPGLLYKGMTFHWPIILSGFTFMDPRLINMAREQTLH